MERKEQEINQDRRLKTTVQGDNNQPPPQKCPRCESINTKFCYYNNYSLSQPRYFCKSCRRYWTQGGTLRNVPVGGGCRKGKRLKTSAAAPPSSGGNLGPQLQPRNQNLVANSAVIARKESQVPANLIDSPSIGSIYPAGGFLSSLAAVQNLSNSSINQPQLPVNCVDLGGIAASNLSILNGFSGGIAQQGQIYPIESQNWQQFSSNNSNSIVADTALWSVSTSATAANNNGNVSTTVSSSISPSAASFPLNPSDNQWPHLSGYGNSPP